MKVEIEKIDTFFNKTLGYKVQYGLKPFFSYNSQNSKHERKIKQWKSVILFSFLSSFNNNSKAFDILEEIFSFHKNDKQTIPQPRLIFFDVPYFITGILYK